MTDIKTLDYRDTTIGDAAVDGLSGGVLGGVLMAVYLETASLLTGAQLGETLSRFNPQEGDPLVVAFLLHLAVAGVYGILFGVLYRWLVLLRKDFLTPRTAALAGVSYSLLLLLLARGVLLPNAASALMEIPLEHFAIAHLIFGTSVGLLSYRSRVKSVR